MKEPANASGEKLILDYMSRVAEAGLRYLPKGARLEFVGRTRARIERAAGPGGIADPARVAQVLAGLGEPEEIVRHERARIDADRARRRAATPEAGEAAAAAITEPVRIRPLTSRWKPATDAPPPSLIGVLGRGRSAWPRKSPSPSNDDTVPLPADGLATTIVPPDLPRRVPPDLPRGPGSGPPEAASPQLPPDGRPGAGTGTAGRLPAGTGPAGPGSTGLRSVGEVLPGTTPGRRTSAGPGSPDPAPAGAAFPDAAGGTVATPPGTDTAGLPRAVNPVRPRLRMPTSQDLARVARAGGRAARRHPLASAAVVMLGLGVILPFPFWLIGGVAAIASRFFDARDKSVAMLGPLAVALAGTVATAIVMGGHANPVVIYLHALRVDIGLLLRAGCALSAAYLVRRVGQGRRERLPPWKRY
jgi:hypothetical protein